MLKNGVLRRKMTLVSNINITPFVDVVLVLLIVFMISVPETMPSLLIDLPKVEKAAVSVDEPVVITVAKDSTIYLNNRLLQEVAIIEELSIVSNGNKDLRIFIRGDQKTDYGTVAKVISLVSGAGFKKIALVTKS